MGTLFYVKWVPPLWKKSFERRREKEGKEGGKRGERGI